ncbi:MAG: hypothetical protein R2941_04205 [Desulfobacterales bacterium]
MCKKRPVSPDVQFFSNRKGRKGFTTFTGRFCILAVKKLYMVSVFIKIFINFALCVVKTEKAGAVLIRSVHADSGIFSVFNGSVIFSDFQPVKIQPSEIIKYEFSDMKL